jgi:hypothetical protein
MKTKFRSIGLVAALLIGCSYEGTKDGQAVGARLALDGDTGGTNTSGGATGAGHTSTSGASAGTTRSDGAAGADGTLTIRGGSSGSAGSSRTFAGAGSAGTAGSAGGSYVCQGTRNAGRGHTVVMQVVNQPTCICPPGPLKLPSYCGCPSPNGGKCISGDGDFWVTSTFACEAGPDWVCGYL